MKMRKHILMNSVAIPAIAAFFAAAAPQPLLAKESGTGARGLRLAQSSGSTAPGHHKVTKGDQKYPGSASRIKQRPRPQSQAVAQLESEAIKPPSDPVARKAFDVLEKHCARCHQAGRLVNRTKPDKDFGNVLKLDEIARNTSLVLPGNPDASPLFTQIVNRQMPYDVYRQNSGGAEPTAEELDALRNWIESLQGAEQTVAAVCGARKPVDLATLTSMIAADVDKAAADRRAGLRYVTLSHLYNSCADAGEMAAYRQAVVKLLNALSRKQETVAVETVGADAGILRFHLDDLGWSAAEWNRILAAYPYAMGPRGESAAALRERTGTPLPWIRGDWLAYTASRAPLYHELAQRPAGSESLKEQLDSGGQTISALNARLTGAGVNPEAKLNGVEVITALSRRYERNVDLRLAAAEFDVSQKRLREALDGAGIRAYWMKRRLEQGTVPRATFERRFADLVRTVSGAQLIDTTRLAAAKPAQVATPSETGPAGGNSFDLTLFSDKSVYKQNDLAVFTVRSKRDCKLTLINVDSQGNGTVIFPNRFQQDNFLAADKVLKFPADDAKFQFRLKDKGTETVIAVCDARRRKSSAIKHDFKTRSFTPLGNYRKFLFRQIAVERAEEKKAAEQSTAQRVSSSGGPTASGATPPATGQGTAQQPPTGQQGTTTQTPPPAAASGGTQTVGGMEDVVRTAIKFEVK